MANPEQMKIAIQSVIKTMMDRVMNRVLIEDPFIEEEHRAKKPLYAALVPDEIFKGFHGCCLVAFTGDFNIRWFFKTNSKYSRLPIGSMPSDRAFLIGAFPSIKS